MAPGLHVSGRLAGIDYGTVRIGIAVSDARQTLASPLESYQRRSADQDAQRFRALVRDESIVQFVVGLPLHLDGHESQKSAEARRFGAWLAETTGVPVVFFDEQFTSVEAESLLSGAALSRQQRRRRVDMLAAQIMLAAYLESPRSSSAETGKLDD